MRRRAQSSKAKLMNRAAMLAAALLLGASEAHAQDAPASTEVDAAPAVRTILISIPDRKLALMENGVVLKVYPIAVGKGATPTPTGEYKVINRIVNPTWYGHESRVPVPPGPENPLGTRWMGLSKKSYGIHGTNAPKSIGKRASKGCIRMAQADLEELFDLVRVGDVVRLEGTRTAEVAAVFGAPAPAVQPAVAAPVVVAATL